MTESSRLVDISVIVPVYGCSSCLRALHERVSATLRAMSASYELILIDDCDGSNSWDICVELAKQDHAVKVYRMSRNFGQHAAITAGLANCSGKWAVVMDCDLQDPPENIPSLYAKALEGFDVVLARRKEKRYSLFRRVASRLYFKLMNVFSKTPHDGEFGSFSMISRKVIDAFLQFQDRDRHYLFILMWLGFRTVFIDYEHALRHSGRSSYDLGRLISLAFDGMFFQTAILLRWIVYAGLWISCCGFLMAGYYVYMYFVHSVAPGFTSLAVLILLIGGFIIMSTGITGLYIGKVFDQVKGRPLYVIDKTIIDGKVL
jgi:glycosyltransferase involved in cell wall biosynthesis